MLYTMIKVCIFNKSNGVSRFNIFEKSPRYLLTCYIKTGAAQMRYDIECKAGNIQL